jgi:RNA polymerase sigma-70 factor (ECF subfamily)
MNKVVHKAPLFFINSYLKESAPKSNTAHTQNNDVTHHQTIDKLFRNHWRDVCRLLHKCYGSGPPEPEDVAQEAFSRFAQMKDTSEVQDPKAYIIKIAINITLKSIGQLTKNREFLAEQLQLNEDQLDDVCPETILQNEQRIAALQKGTEQLTEKQRDILMRVRIKGQTYVQISADTGWSLADISRQLNSAMAILESVDTDAQFTNTNTKIHLNKTNCRTAY